MFKCIKNENQQKKIELKKGNHFSVDFIGKIKQNISEFSKNRKMKIIY